MNEKFSFWKNNSVICDGKSVIMFSSVAPKGMPVDNEMNTISLDCFAIQIVRRYGGVGEVGCKMK